MTQLGANQSTLMERPEAHPGNRAQKRLFQPLPAATTLITSHLTLVLRFGSSTDRPAPQGASSPNYRPSPINLPKHSLSQGLSLPIALSLWS